LSHGGRYRTAKKKHPRDARDLQRGLLEQNKEKFQKGSKRKHKFGKFFGVNSEDLPTKNNGLKGFHKKKTAGQRWGVFGREAGKLGGRGGHAVYAGLVMDKSFPNLEGL